MGNAAHDLADLLENLRPEPTENPMTRRRTLSESKEGRLEFWHWMRDALRAVERFEVTVERARQRGLPMTTDYGSDLVEYYRCIWAPGVNWSGRDRGELIEAQPLRQLRMIGDVLAIAGDDADLTDDQRLSTVLESLIAARSLVEDIESDDLARHHLLWQIQQAIRFAEHLDVFGPEATTTLIADVVRATVEYAEGDDVDQTTRERLLQVAARIAKETFYSTSGTAAMLLGAEALKAIGLG